MPISVSGTYTKPRLDLSRALEQLPTTNEGFIADQVFVPAPVMKKAGNFSAITRASIGRRRKLDRAKSGSSNRDTYETTDVSFATLEYSHEQLLDDTDRELYASDFQAEVYAASIAARVIRHGREVRAAAALFNATTFTGSALTTDVSGSGPWATTSTDTRAQIQAARDKVRQNCGVYPNAIIMGAGQIARLVANTVLSGDTKYVQLPTLQAQLNVLAAYWGVDRVLIGGAVENSADEGLTYSGADIWGTTYVMVALLAPAGSAVSERGLSRLIRWSEMQGGGDVLIDSYREEQTKSDVFRASEWVQEKVIDPYFGHLLKVA